MPLSVQYLCTQNKAVCPGRDLNPHAIEIARDFKSLVSTDSTTWAGRVLGIPSESWAGVEPAHVGFANRCVNHFATRTRKSMTLLAATVALFLASDKAFYCVMNASFSAPEYVIKNERFR